MSLDAKALLESLPAGAVIEAPQSPPHLAAPWQKGKSANPKGRPRGARHKISMLFVKRLYADFEEHGEVAIAKARHQDPVAYIKVIASLLPKDIKLDVSDDTKKFMQLVASGAQVVTGPDGHQYLDLPASAFGEIAGEGDEDEDETPRGQAQLPAPAGNLQYRDSEPEFKDQHPVASEMLE